MDRSATHESLKMQYLLIMNPQEKLPQREASSFSIP
jgi:hypothetical protein